jgi:hypothetical protein
MRTQIGIRALISGAVLSMAAAGSYAGTTTCTITGSGSGNYDISGKVTGSTDCLILTPLDGAVNDVTSNKPISDYIVNMENFFGFSSWAFDGKYDISSQQPTDGLGYFSFTGGGQAGTYTRLVTPSPDTQFMFVMKDGAGTNLVAYLLSPLASSGTYSSPFTNPPFAAPGATAIRAKDISHISVYFLTDPGGPGTGVPEPGTIAMLGLGLLGIGLVSARRKSQQH